ncbi:MAG: hypothetical protein IIZ92_03575 [Aquincola sp.]|nr:hypothetical protein [Aquincola sp.]
MTTTPHAELLTPAELSVELDARGYHWKTARRAFEEGARWAERALLARLGEQQPVDMVLHCPACGMQHIDGPEVTLNKCIYSDPDWDNLPHRSHKCDGCGHIWRPADVPTNGVAAVTTKGKADSPIAARASQPTPAQDAAATVPAGDGTAFLCRIWGEDIDHTLTAIVPDWDGVRQFCIDYYTGSADHTDHYGKLTLQTLKEEFDEHEADQRGGAYTEQWEIGGLSIERICDCTPPAPQAAPTAAATVPWNPMATAPTNGDPVLLLIEDNEHPLYDETMSVSIGSYGVEGGPKEDPTWHFAGWSWHQDCYCRGEGRPIGWLPIPGASVAAPTAVQPVADIPAMPPYTPEQRAAACAVACEGLSDHALFGGWTAAGMSRYTQSLESKLAAQAPALVPLTDADRQDAEAYRRINTPEVADFLAGVHNEALHQRERWGAEGDAGKTDADWYWLVGYLAGKAIRPDATPEKQLHHIITTAAALLNWHAARIGAYAAMRPGIDPVAHGITADTAKGHG